MEEQGGEPKVRQDAGQAQISVPAAALAKRNLDSQEIGFQVEKKPTPGPKRRSTAILGPRISGEPRLTWLRAVAAGPEVGPVIQSLGTSSAASLRSRSSWVSDMAVLSIQILRTSTADKQASQWESTVLAMPTVSVGLPPPRKLTRVCIWCFPLRDDRFLRVRRRARMWVRKQQYPCQPICLVPKRRQKAICLPSPQIYTYPCQHRGRETLLGSPSRVCPMRKPPSARSDIRTRTRNPDAALPSSLTISRINPNSHSGSNVTADQSSYINRVCTGLI